MRNTVTMRRPAPKLGFLIATSDVFSPDAKDQSEKDLRAFVSELGDSGLIHPDSLIRGRALKPHEARAAADEFAAERVDLIVIVNTAFPNGQAFVTLACHPHLRGVPLAIIADPEPDTDEWATNAWCGVIMNNYAAHQIGRPIAAIPGPLQAQSFREDFARLLRVAGTIRDLRKDFVCRFGDAPGGFHSATGHQLAFAEKFGTLVDTVDLTAVMDAYRTSSATGYLGESSFTEDDVRRTVAEVTANREILVPADMLERGARLYHAFRAIIRANGYTSASFRCWPEHNESFIGITPCMAMGLLLANGDVTAAGCEGDWPTAVAQTIGSLLSGRPAVCLDWVDYTGLSDITRLGHCGMGVCGAMASSGEGRVCDAIALHPVQRLAGNEMGPVHIGQMDYGPKTGICLVQAPNGRFKILAFHGKSSSETDRGVKYSAADVRVPDHRRLNELILEHGFPHHLAVAMGEITEDVRLLCRFLDVDYLSPHD